ncbi:hypothetical protein KP509_17G055100 [Ceratopteris richardii]|uniref:AN1-type domain-containing protein n=1 Tax=Ceratopteris richardii TaxID=49495 RepID=A0A8T2SYE3_CERRI|nr:hypothetical protein KP509_17G055100 [Ceratopteris richardii]
MGGTEAFPELGAHCSQPDCHLLDFLPFNCDSCKQTFCLEHRSYSAHNCTKEGLKDSRVIICPICASSVRTVFGENIDLTLEKHMQVNCDPNNYDRIMKKPKCPVKRCREVMTTTNTYMCKTCKLKVCLKHRFPADHLCMSGVKTREASLETLSQNFMKILSQRRGTECASSSTQAGSKIGSPASQNVSAH